MNFSELFIRRPVTTVLVMAGILFFGINAYGRLPVSDLPTVDFPTITVNASLPGASPETMASAVATPLEKQFSTIAGIDNMTSTSTLGSTSITIQFSLDRPIDAAAQDVQSMIAKTLRDLPPGIIPPSYQKVNPADQAILYYAFTSQLMPLSQLDEYAETMMAQRISMVAGVAQVNVYGSQKYAVRVQLDPNALAQRQLGIDEVATAITSQNVNLPTGVLNGLNKAYTVQANGQLQDAASERAQCERAAAQLRIAAAAWSCRCEALQEPSAGQGPQLAAQRLRRCDQQVAQLAESCSSRVDRSFTGGHKRLQCLAFATCARRRGSLLGEDAAGGTDGVERVGLAARAALSP
jgi:multidrug efflux pump subunit AcrB